MNKHHFERPPMGWNSYDNYDTNVSEAEVLANAEYMAAHLKPFGWEYVVIDIQWYAADTASQRDRYQYLPFSRVNLDDYGRLLPDPVKFPSSADGQGFKPLADRIHAMGLKFGIHIMRGIPREAAHRRLPVLGTQAGADQIADPYYICPWNPDMYGVRDTEDGQRYYDSIIALYDEWGVDYIKCDDICYTDLNRDPFRGEKEIAMLSRAIGRARREIVLSLSPGPALVEKSWVYARYANLWRITGDFWDSWTQLKDMFARCERWQDHVRIGAYPDCDMLPLGHIGDVFGEGRETRLTPAEQQTMMTLWCVFRSPLMLGADLTRLDADTLRLITNRKLLQLNTEGHLPRQLRRDDREAVWITDGPEGTTAALFNLSDEPREIALPLAEINRKECRGTELWTGENIVCQDVLTRRLPAHGCAAITIKE